MKLSLKKAFKHLAGIVPTVAKLVLGSRGEAILDVVKNALDIDSDATQDAVAQVIANASPEQIEKLRQVDLMFARLDLEHDQAFLGDRQSARKMGMETGTGRQFVLSLVILTTYLLLAVGFGYALISELEINTDLLGLFQFVFGAITVAFTSVIAYWFGTTRGSARKTDQIFELKTNGGGK